MARAYTDGQSEKRVAHTHRRGQSRPNVKTFSPLSPIRGNIDLSHPQQLHRREMLVLQQSIGNRAVRKILTRPAHTFRPTPQTSLGRTVVQRYVASEHMKFGATGGLIGAEEKRHLLPEAAHVVAKAEMPPEIAAKYRVSVDFLLARNARLLRTWTTASGKRLRGFNAGATIVIPGTTLTELATKYGVPAMRIAKKPSEKSVMRVCGA